MTNIFQPNRTHTHKIQSSYSKTENLSIKPTNVIQNAIQTQNERYFARTTKAHITPRISRRRTRYKTVPKFKYPNEISEFRFGIIAGIESDGRRRATY